jgi:hypothetical protein
MATWHGYFAIEDLNLLPVQRETLIAELKALGPGSHPMPACLNHWRTRLDGTAAIFEALFDEDALTVAAFKNRLASIFLVNPDSIDHALVGHTFDTLVTPVVTFSRTGTDYIRMALFGGPSATWASSGAECRAYLALYADQWEEEPG